MNGSTSRIEGYLRRRCFCINRIYSFTNIASALYMGIGAYSMKAAWIGGIVSLCLVSGGHLQLSKHRTWTFSRVILSASSALNILLSCGINTTLSKRSDVCTSKGCRRSSPNSSEIGQFTLRLQPGRKGGTIATRVSSRQESAHMAKADQTGRWNRYRLWFIEVVGGRDKRPSFCRAVLLDDMYHSLRSIITLPQVPRSVIL